MPRGLHAGAGLHGLRCWLLRGGLRRGGAYEGSFLLFYGPGPTVEWAAALPLLLPLPLECNITNSLHNHPQLGLRLPIPGASYSIVQDEHTTTTWCTACSSVDNCGSYTDGKNEPQITTGLTAEGVCPLGSFQEPTCLACAAGFYGVRPGLQWTACGAGACGLGEGKVSCALVRDWGGGEGAGLWALGACSTGQR